MLYKDDPVCQNLAPIPLFPCTITLYNLCSLCDHPGLWGYLFSKFIISFDVLPIELPR